MSRSARTKTTSGHNQQEVAAPPAGDTTHEPKTGEGFLLLGDLARTSQVSTNSHVRVVKGEDAMTGGVMYRLAECARGAGNDERR